jgi:hypothetical protein
MNVNTVHIEQLQDYSDSTQQEDVFEESVALKTARCILVLQSHGQYRDEALTIAIALVMDAATVHRKQ